MAAPAAPFDVEFRFIALAPGGETGRPALDLEFRDYTQASPAGITGSLSMPQDVVPLGAGKKGTLQEAQERFAAGAWREADALDFGEWLLTWLTSGHPEIRSGWNDVVARARREERPLRLQLSFPESLGLPFDPSSLPFELLASARAFLFRQPGWSIVRTFHELEASRITLGRDSVFGVVWANPALGNAGPLPQSVFDDHQAALASGAEKMGARLLPPCRQASRKSLQSHFDRHGKAHLLSIVAHGPPQGGQLWLHDDASPAYPRDGGRPVSAGDLATDLAAAGTRAAFLWACHGAKRHDGLDSLAAQLLRQAGLSAVLAAQVPVQARQSAELARAIFDSLDSADSLDAAINRGRRELPGGDLQWAVPVFYARPERGESVTFERSLELEFRQILDRRRGERFVHGAPDLAPHFRGREEQIADVLDLVTAHRLVSLTGLPGIGKSELARAVLDRMEQKGGSRPVDRAVWISLLGMEHIASLATAVSAAVFPERRDIGDATALAQALRGESLLLVLDNAEYLIGADRHGLQRFIGDIANVAPNLRFLLTTRREAGQCGSLIEHAHTVDVLSPPHDREAFLAEAAPRLTPQELDPTSTELDDLIRLLDGHPRSLLLIAGQAGRNFTVAELLHRVRTRQVDAVEAYEMIGERVSGATEERAKRLIASLEIAFSSLEQSSGAAAEMFCWLALFPAGLPSVLAAPIFGESAAESVAILRRQGMVQLTGSDRRLRLPAPLRWYARRRMNGLEQDQRSSRLFAVVKAMALWLHHHHDNNCGKPDGRTAIALQAAAQEGESLSEIAGALSQDPGLPALDEIWRVLAPGVQAWAEIERFAGRAASAATLIESLRQQCSGEARARLCEALGDLQVRTARLKDAEASYREALIYRQIEARLGEANTLKGLGNLALAERMPARSFDLFRQALTQHQSIENSLGVAGSLGYLARAAAAAGETERAVVLGVLAWQGLEKLDDRYGAGLALMDVARSLSTLDHKIAVAALYLSWIRRKEIGDPSAAALESPLKEAIPSFDPETVDQELSAACEGAVIEAAAGCRKALDEKRADPLGPLSGKTP